MLWRCGGQEVTNSHCTERRNARGELILGGLYDRFASDQLDHKELEILDQAEQGSKSIRLSVCVTNDGSEEELNNQELENVMMVRRKGL